MAQSRPPITPLPLSRRDERPSPRAGLSISLRRPTLPVPLTRFIGRERELAEVARLLETTRLLTLTGSGGNGKTRLALAVAARGTATARDGVFLVELADLADETLVPRAVAAALGIHEEPHRPLVDTLADALQIHVPLLLLDNCEHLIAAAAALVTTLLRSCPNLRILATSREALRVPGELTWRVPPLSLPDPTDTHSATRLIASEAVQLFVDRVRLRQPAFVLTDQHAPAVAAICRRLDGMPLALELAAARANALALPELAARLDDALGLLTQGSRTAPPQQQTLRAALDWSYDLLTARERILLRRLAVFAGGCDLTAAEAICCGGEIAPADVLICLANLVDKSLVAMEERATRARYRLLETVRQYAQERLAASGEMDTVADTHAAWYLTFVEQVGPALNGPEMVVWLDRLEEEHDNVRAALQQLLKTEQEEAGLRLCANIFLFWYARDHVNEGRQWFHAFLALPTSSERATTRAFAQYSAARLAIYQGDYGTANTLLDSSLALARAQAQDTYVAYALTQLGHVALFQGDFAAARAHYTEALPIRRQLGDPRGIAIVIGSLGRTALFAGDIAAARTYLEESLAIFRRVVAHTDTVGILCDLGYVAIAEDDRARAEAYMREGLTSAQQWDIKHGSAQCLEGYAALAVVCGRHERALRLAGAAESTRQAINHPAPPVLRDWLTRALAPARHALGPAGAAAFTAGAAMTLDAAVAAALTSDQPAATDRRPAKERDGGLSAREREVIALVAAGRLNREIADALFVTEKTIEWHVSNSLRKLGFRSRAELAVWAVTADLAPASPPESTEAGRA